MPAPLTIDSLVSPLNDSAIGDLCCYEGAGNGVTAIGINRESGCQQVGVHQRFRVVNT